MFEAWNNAEKSLPFTVARKGEQVAGSCPAVPKTRSAECGVRSAECGVRSAECGVRSLKKNHDKKKIEIKQFQSELK